MHKKSGNSVSYIRHTRLHHGVFYREFTNDPDPAAQHVSIELGGPIVLYYSLPVIFLLWAVSLQLSAVILAITGILYGEFWSFVHLKMHEPNPHWFVSTRYFKLMETHHKLHHEHPSYNFGAVFLGLWDTILGTSYARR